MKLAQPEAGEGERLLCRAVFSCPGEASGVHTQAALLVLSLAPVHVVTTRQACFLPSHLCA